MKDDSRKLVRIVPPPPSADGYTQTQGTKVMLGDVAIPGVTKIHLFAWPNNVWRADITVMCEPPEVPAGAMLEVVGPLTWWRRLLLRMAGVDTIDVTAIDSIAREFRTP